MHGIMNLESVFKNSFFTIYNIKCLNCQFYQIYNGTKGVRDDCVSQVMILYCPTIVPCAV